MAARQNRGRPASKLGTIATFFSFKGGVGRTMALANCAFVAAMNGARVLVMDWDLEAPGLGYYFRGLQSQRGAGEIRQAKGVLDLFWGWQTAVDGAATSEALLKRLEPYRTHAIFESCANSLVDRSRIPPNARLDMISAGAPFIACPEELPYAEALSRFSWSEFFEKRAGGNLIHQLGAWCRQNYDLTLIDSRTGLADVSGICTMQIPDQVYLCFAFNRQNIDGTAQVAQSIIAAQKERIKVRVVPMRVSTEMASAEESDARARAARDFKRAGLPAAQVDSDLKALSIPATPGVPYYEALTPFYSNEYTAGDLNWAYQRLTRELLGRELDRLIPDPHWSDEVRQRLQPSVSTVEYLKSLETADPDRAIDEIERFLAGALDADPAREIDGDYVRVLVAATFEALDRVIEDDEAGIRRIESKTLRLIEQMHLLAGGDWREDFVAAMDEFEYRVRRTLEDIEGDLQWKDRVLAKGAQSAEILIQRATVGVTLARVARDQENSELALERATRAEELSEKAAAAGASSGELQRVRVDVADVRARVGLQRDPAGAVAQFAVVLDQASGSNDMRVRTLAAEAHLTLAELEPERRGDHLIAAAALDPRRVLRDVERLQAIVAAVGEADETGQAMVALAERLFGQDKEHRFVPNYGRSARTAQDFAKVANRMLRATQRTAPDSASGIAPNLANIAARTLSQWSRHRRNYRKRDSEASIAEMISSYQVLAERLRTIGLGGRPLALLQDALDAVRTDVGDGNEGEDAVE